MQDAAHRSHAARSGTHSRAPQVSPSEALQGVGATQRLCVGLRRVINTTKRRARFIGRFIYWTCKHGSTQNAGWVCNYEGLYW